MTSILTEERILSRLIALIIKYLEVNAISITKRPENLRRWASNAFLGPENVPNLNRFYEQVNEG